MSVYECFSRKYVLLLLLDIRENDRNNNWKSIMCQSLK